MGWKEWPEGKQFALVLTHDVDTQKGHDNILQLVELEESLGFRSCFNFVPERYKVSPRLREELRSRGFEVGVHGLFHDGKYFVSRDGFRKRANIINRYIKEWGAMGYRSPSMHYNLDWFHDLDVLYDSSTFDTDPFEPDPRGQKTIYPFYVNDAGKKKCYIELPYTLPQDFTLFILMREKNINIWKKKLDWIAEQGGMALINVHPDYLCYDGNRAGSEEYPVKYYQNFLVYVKENYKERYWHVLPRELAGVWGKKR